MIKQKNSLKFKISVVVAILLFSALIYFSINYSIHEVHEDTFAETPLISPNQALEYKTEFCANKLTALIHETHFFEKDISAGEEIKEKDTLIQKEEIEVISLEQRELEEVKEEFESYKLICDDFDEQPTKELCEQFLTEAKADLELAQQNAESSDGVLSWIETSHKNLRRANRIYNELNKTCQIFNIS
jgi:hypothetical protein